ncbi:phosphatidylserine decarboxylase [Alkaliphilus peptidifermentans]|uniref:Phosphatidylserine decarboxylase proenzyme n=1 Tax=Alkaliphilus peptidifermentans DSM 18978 TaxID=1120976 RepID=A0A1G5GIG3_9FIRM|nr:phosphatidylserine decarboxylase [Alkaliphilus peptidifermentans]SCY50498.1 phosphatidylserine decarboxylase [Alkaliphilus peptidifermentans DSM 18978]
MKIFFVERKTGELKVETVAGDAYLRWTYDTKMGRSILENIMKKKFFSKMIGLYMESPFSRRRLTSFINELSIDMSEALNENISGYKSFNDFFIRKLKPEARPIAKDEEILISPADGRVLVYDNINVCKVVQVKGLDYSLEELIGDKELANSYEGGVCIITRLNPSDYHRFHFPDGGIPITSKRIEGSYYSVNPLALKKVAALYCKNKREITIFQSNNFGEILMIEVGATCVGTIVQTYKKDKQVLKGEEKGFFKFGGSTTIMFIKKDKVKLDSDLIKNSDEGYETKVYMGEGIGKRN